MPNAKSYDPRMEDLPVLISYPRSGSNWLNAVMELYFDRPRLRQGPTTFMDPKRKDFMWFHDHDIHSDLSLSHNNILYLYRDPCDVIFSLLMAEHGKINKDLVNEQVGLIKAHREKYLGGNYPALCYERCKHSLYHEFWTILKFFGAKEDIDGRKLSECAKKVSKKSIVDKATDKRYFNSAMMSEEYEQKRALFKVAYEKPIYKNLRGLL